MSCERAREQLTAYLDGELAGELGSALRGHLRTCEACRTIATDEAALRDGLRTLPTVDPPASLWAGVQARLAAAEMADAEKPEWRRTVARWTQLATRPRFGFAGFAIVAAIAVLAWRINRHAGHDESPVARTNPTVVLPAPVPQPAPVTPELASQDVTADLAGEAARASQDFASTADELQKLAHEARSRWSDDHKHAFDTHVVELRHAIETAPEGRKRHKAYRTLIRYLQGAAVRDEVAMVSVQGAP